MHHAISQRQHDHPRNLRNCGLKSEAHKIKEPTTLEQRGSNRHFQSANLKASFSQTPSSAASEAAFVASSLRMYFPGTFTVYKAPGSVTLNLKP